MRVRPTVRVAGALLALVSVACGSRVRQEEWDALAAGGVSPRATVRGGDDTALVDDTRVATATTSARRRTATASERPATTVASALPAPADGTYTYDENSEGARRTTTEQWSARRASGSVTLTSVKKEQEDGDTFTTTTNYRVTSRAFELVSETSTYNGEEPDTCTYKPPALVLPLPMKTGAKWKTSATCEGDDPSDEDALSFEITGTKADTVGGKQITTFVVRGTQSFDTTDDTTGERTTYTFTDTRHVDPDTLLVVVEDITFNFGGDSNTIHRQLRSLTPT